MRLLLIGAIAILLAPQVEAAGINFPPSDFNIVNPTTGTVIGQSHYEVIQSGSDITVRGQNRFMDGETDAEEDQMTQEAGAPLAKLLRFNHAFYAPDGTLQLQGAADLIAGTANCVDNRPQSQTNASQQMKFPPDTFAGASILLPIQQFMSRTHGIGTLKINAFSCAPSPKVIPVSVTIDPVQHTWTYHAGNLDMADITPDFGLMDVVISHFIPRLDAWFDPDSDWALIGARLERFYRGPTITMVRAAAPKAIAPAARAAGDSVR
jgi:hypothetical protein